MTIDLPKPIADYVAANARLDVEGMVRPFAPDAVVIDVGIGKRFEGQPGLRALFQEEVIPVRAIFSPDALRHDNGKVLVEGTARGDFRGSPLRFTYGFTLRDDAVQALEITL